jgi:hypothetical protein
MQAEKVLAAMRARKSKLPPAVTARDILRQARRDLFDKEVQHTYTTSYDWMTNQVSHFGLGFLATFLLVWIVQIVHSLYVCGLPPTGIWLSCAIEPHHFVGWMLLVPAFEIALWARMEYKDYTSAKQDAKGNCFVFDARDVARDALTALWFIAAGMAVAYLSFIAWTFALAAFAGGAIVSLIPAGYWLSRKLCFQQAALPYLYRLADFGNTFAPRPEQGVATVNDYLTRARPIRHLLIFGVTGAGRTSLAVAIATEHTFFCAQRPVHVLGETRRDRPDQPGGCRARWDLGLAMARERHCCPRRRRQSDRRSILYVPGSYRCGSRQAASRSRIESCGAADHLGTGPGSGRLDHQAIRSSEYSSG